MLMASQKCGRATLGIAAEHICRTRLFLPGGCALSAAPKPWSRVAFALPFPCIRSQRSSATAQGSRSPRALPWKNRVQTKAVNFLVVETIWRMTAARAYLVEGFILLNGARFFSWREKWPILNDLRPLCKYCKKPMLLKVSASEKNNGREYYKCCRFVFDQGQSIR